MYEYLLSVQFYYLENYSIFSPNYRGSLNRILACLSEISFSFIPDYANRLGDYLFRCLLCVCKSVIVIHLGLLWVPLNVGLNSLINLFCRSVTP